MGDGDRGVLSSCSASRKCPPPPHDPPICHPFWSCPFLLSLPPPPKTCYCTCWLPVCNRFLNLMILNFSSSTQIVWWQVISYWRKRLLHVASKSWYVRLLGLLFMIINTGGAAHWSSKQIGSLPSGCPPLSGGGWAGEVFSTQVWVGVWC